jgi:hypothetical protein
VPKIFDVLLGRSRPVQANLDALFGLVGAQITLQASESLVPTAQAGVCFKPVAGRSFSDTATEANQLLGLASSQSAGSQLVGSQLEGSQAGAPSPVPSVGPVVHQEDDEYGFHWIVQTVADFQELVNQVHLINSTLQDNGYGPQLLCTVFAFHPDPRAPATSKAPAKAYLVYLYKRGAFYPFVPLPGEEEKRDVETELLLARVLADDLKIEADKERWMPLWGLPVR